MQNDKVSKKQQQQQQKMWFLYERNMVWEAIWHGEEWRPTSLADCDIMRSRTSCEVAEEAKENWLPHMVENSSEACSEMELVTLTEEGALGGLEGM